MPTLQPRMMIVLGLLAACGGDAPAGGEDDEASGDVETGEDASTSGSSDPSASDGSSSSTGVATTDADEASSSSSDGGNACADPTGAVAPIAEPVELAGVAAPFDDLRYSATLGKVIAIPQGLGVVHLVDPETLAVTSLDGLPNGIASADEIGGRLFVADRGGEQVLVLDPSDGSIVGLSAVSAHPDYLRISPATSEVWVTEPGAARIEVLSVDGDALAHAADIAVSGGPEGVAFDVSRRRAYAQQFAGAIAVIDVDARATIDSWPSGCSGAHGIPVVDEARGLVFAGCSNAGGAAMLDADDGTILATYEVGSGEAILAYAPALGRFYLRGDPGPSVAFLAPCDGELALLGTSTTAQHGHGMVADDRGNAWVCDADHGRILRLQDPWPPS